MICLTVQETPEWDMECFWNSFEEFMEEFHSHSISDSFFPCFPDPEAKLLKIAYKTKNGIVRKKFRKKMTVRKFYETMRGRRIETI